MLMLKMSVESVVEFVEVVDAGCGDGVVVDVELGVEDKDHIVMHDEYVVARARANAFMVVRR
eukprot:5768357-Amphidinium_carterae.1